MDRSIANEIEAVMSDADVAALKQRSDWQGARAAHHLMFRTRWMNDWFGR